jgi:hypothetical protein
MLSRDDRNLALTDLYPVPSYTYSQPTFQDLERQRASLVILIQRRASTERDENQSKRPCLDQGAGIPVAVDVGRFRAQPGSFLFEFEAQERGDQRARIALGASTRGRESVSSLTHACPTGRHLDGFESIAVTPSLPRR